MAPMYTEFPFPKHLFEKFIRENEGKGAAACPPASCPCDLKGNIYFLSPFDTPLPRISAGYFPVTIEALPEGTAIHARVPVYQVGGTNHHRGNCC